MEEELAMEGIDVRLVGGKIVREEWEGKDAIEKVRGIRLLYLFEKELRVEKAMMPIEKIEIAKKEVLKP
jgi:abortive infection bacteriophage resistance protein